MKHCLNKRNHHETSFDEQEDLPQKLQTRNKGQFEELKDSTDAWWRATLKWQEEIELSAGMPGKTGDQSIREEKSGNVLTKEKNGEK